MPVSALLNVGVIGLGRMGQLYARMLATQIPGVRLRAIADSYAEATSKVAEELAVAPQRAFVEPQQLLDLPDIEAVVIATPTSTHRDLVVAAARAGKAIFCEKPLALSLEDNIAAVKEVARAGVQMQVGFMRRFDSGYQRAKALIDEGRIGYPVTFKSISRDPFCPPPNYLDPAMSGGLIIDMGIHDFDLARWLVGSEVQRVSAEGTTLVCKDLAAVGDIDNALVNMRFVSGALGNVEASRNAFYGYDIRTEVLGSEGAVMIGVHQHTPALLLTRSGAQHDIKPYLIERFGDAYRAQLQHFVDSVRLGQSPSVGGEAALAAFKVGLAATRALELGRAVELSELESMSS